MAQALAFPLLTLRNHAPSQFSCYEHSWLVYLIKMRVYMMPHLIYAVCRDIPSVTIPNQKHNITKSMVGPWPLAPHQYYLQYMQVGLKLGYYIPLPLQYHCPQCFIKLNKNDTLALPLVIYRIEQKWLHQLHGILHLPCSLFRTVVLPLHLYLPYGSVLEHCDLPVEDAHWLDLELSLRFHLNHIPNLSHG